ncbi:hypothetical protein, partial [Moorena sp. SIO3B2]
MKKSSRQAPANFFSTKDFESDYLREFAIALYSSFVVTYSHTLIEDYSVGFLPTPAITIGFRRRGAR